MRRLAYPHGWVRRHAYTSIPICGAKSSGVPKPSEDPGRALESLSQMRPGILGYGPAGRYGSSEVVTARD